MKKYIILSIIALISLNSCVSKKKFNKLALDKIKSDESINKLQIENKQLEDNVLSIKEEANSIRYKLTYNNAQKDSFIDSLSLVLQKMKSEQELLNSEIDNNNEKQTKYSLSRKKLIQDLESQMNKLTDEKNSLEQEMISLRTDSRFNLERKENEMLILKENIKTRDFEINEIKKEIDIIKKKNSSLKEDNKLKEEEIAKLNNQIKLLKKSFSN